MAEPEPVDHLGGSETSNLSPEAIDTVRRVAHTLEKEYAQLVEGIIAENSRLHKFVADVRFNNAVGKTHALFRREPFVN